MVEPQGAAQVFGPDQWREAGAQVDRGAGRRREQVSVAPDGRRPRLDRGAGNPTAEGIEIVDDLERAETLLADVGRLELAQPPALSTSQPHPRYLLDVIAPRPALPRWEGK